MTTERGVSLPAAIGIAALSLLATAVPLPHLLELVRPDFVALTVLWLCLMAPRVAGLGFAFLCGLALDAFTGLVLGEHAFALLSIAYAAARFRLRIRMFPLGHQALTVLSLLWLYQFLLFWIDGVTGHPIVHWGRWLPVLTGAALWPVLTGLYGRLPVRR